MSKVLVTGATGFIGHYVVEQLLDNNFNVIATSRNAEKAKQAAWFSRVTYIPFDFNNYKEDIDYFSHFHSPDFLIHLSWEGLPHYKNDIHLLQNLPRHSTFLKNLIDNGLKDLTITGTCLEYGMQTGELSETMEPKPDNAYAIAKNKLRIAIENYIAGKQVSFKWARLFYMYGKGQSPSSLFSQLDKALEQGDTSFNMSAGEQERDFLPVEKVSEYIVAVAAQQSIGGTVNICSGTPVKIINLVKSYLSEKNKEIQLNTGFYPYPDYEPMYFWGDTQKLKSIISTQEN